MQITLKAKCTYMYLISNQAIKESPVTTSDALSPLTIRLQISRSICPHAISEHATGSRDSLRTGPINPSANNSGLTYIPPTLRVISTNNKLPSNVVFISIFCALIIYHKSAFEKEKEMSSNIVIPFPNTQSYHTYFPSMKVNFILYVSKLSR